MKLTRNILKSNKGFTMQDAVVAIIIILLFSGTIGSLYMAIYKLKADTMVDSVASLFMVQIMERIDKVSYEKVEESEIPALISKMRDDFSIPDAFKINVEVLPDANTDKYVKTVQVTINYSFSGRDMQIVMKRLKVKELELEVDI